MKCKHTASLAVLLLISCLPAQGQTPAAKIDVQKLVRSVQVNGEALSKQVFDYSWTSSTRIKQFDKRGKILKQVEQDHEVYPSPGLTYVVQKLVKENGLPLSAKRAAKEQKRFELELWRAELAQAAFSDGTATEEEKSDCPNFGIWTVLNGSGGKETSLGISDFLCFAEFFSPRVESRNGRETVILQFRPRGSLISVPKEKTPFTKLAGIIWIDLKDRVVTHVEAWPGGTPAAGVQSSPADGPPIVFDDMRLPDGTWVRRLRYIDTRKDPQAFNRLNLEWRQEFRSYQRYFTEFKDFKIQEPEKPDKPETQPPNNYHHGAEHRR